MIKGCMKKGCLILYILFVIGCGQSNPPFEEDRRFAPRTDPIIVRIPTAEITKNRPEGPIDSTFPQLVERGGVMYRPENLSPQFQAQLSNLIQEYFGTPAHPLIHLSPSSHESANGTNETNGTGLSENDRLQLQQLEHSLTNQLMHNPEQCQEGGRLYRRHCLQCHGMEGDGRGPTGSWIFPHPRDFRSGFFKYVSSQNHPGRPLINDLQRTLKRGIPGTSMPSFALLDDHSRDAIISFVIYLSIRGEVERAVMLNYLQEEDSENTELSANEIERTLKKIVLRWLEVQDHGALKVPDPLLENQVNENGSGPGINSSSNENSAKSEIKFANEIERGYRLFMSAGSCSQCHTNFGRDALYRFDAWGSLVKPLDLTQKERHGGDFAADIYYRLKNGIFPSQMPSLTNFSDADIIDLVRFVQAIPYPRQLPPNIRTSIYPDLKLEK